MYSCLALQLRSWYEPLLRRSSSKTQATPLGKIEPHRITVEEYQRIQWQGYRKKNLAVGLLLLAGVLTVYGYSIYAVNQDPLKIDDLSLDNEVRTSKSKN